MRTHFIAGAYVVLEALRVPSVAAAWDAPSILEGQTVGALCGHLARGSVWVVADYLELDPPNAKILDSTAPDSLTFETAAPKSLTFETATFETATFETAQDYGVLASALSDDDHVNIRKRGAEVAAMGHDALVAKLEERLATLERRLPNEPTDRIVPVFGGMTMRLDPYLSTRMLEQVVHLDDLARSVDTALPEMPPGNIEIVLDVGTRIGLHRFGSAAMIRGMFRGVPGASPVL